MIATGTERRALRRRRFAFAMAVLGTILAALAAMARVLGADGLGVADIVLLCCFAAMLPWNVIGFWNAVVGFAILCAEPRSVGLRLAGHTLGRRLGRSGRGWPW